MEGEPGVVEAEPEEGEQEVELLVHLGLRVSDVHLERVVIMIVVVIVGVVVVVVLNKRYSYFCCFYCNF